MVLTSVAAHRARRVLRDDGEFGHFFWPEIAQRLRGEPVAA
jgi:hypothetical protein